MYRKPMTATGAICPIVGLLGDRTRGLISPVSETGVAKVSVASMIEYAAGASAAEQRHPTTVARRPRSAALRRLTPPLLGRLQGPDRCLVKRSSAELDERWNDGC